MKLKKSIKQSENDGGAEPSGAGARQSPNRPSYVLAANGLRSRILSGELKPGERLPSEVALSVSLNVSRSTAREALRLLASERLIETRRGVTGGVFVAYPSRSDLERSMNTALGLMARTGEMLVEEVLEAWIILGPAIAALAAERRTDEDAKTLLALAAPLPASAGDDEWVEAAKAFSQAMLGATRNRLLPLLTLPLLTFLPTRLRRHREEPGWWRRNTKEYLAIARAIQRRDAKRAFAIMQRHVQRYGDVQLPVLTKRQEGAAPVRKVKVAPRTRPRRPASDER